MTRYAAEDRRIAWWHKARGKTVPVPPDRLAVLRYGDVFGPVEVALALSRWTGQIMSDSTYRARMDPHRVAAARVASDLAVLEEHYGRLEWWQVTAERRIEEEFHPETWKAQGASQAPLRQIAGKAVGGPGGLPAWHEVPAAGDYGEVPHGPDEPLRLYVVVWGIYGDGQVSHASQGVVTTASRAREVQVVRELVAAARAALLKRHDVEHQGVEVVQWRPPE